MATLIMRPSGVLGDADNGTYETDGPPAGGAVEVLSVTASALTQSADLGTIDSVTLSAVAAVAGSAAPDGYLTWKQSSAESATDESVTLSVGALAEASGTTRTVNPWTGLAWTWTDVNELADLGVTVESAVDPAALTVAEVYVTVEYTAHAEAGTFVTAGSIAGNVPGAAGIGGPVTTGAVTAARGASGIGGPVTVGGIVQARGWEGVA